MTFKDWVIVISAILLTPLEIMWKVLCIVPAMLALPVCVLLDHVERKRGKRAYSVTGMVCTMGRLMMLPRRIFTRFFGEEDDEMKQYLKDVQDIEEKGL